MTKDRGITVHEDKGPVIRWDKVAGAQDVLLKVFEGFTMSKAVLAFSKFSIKQSIRAFTGGFK